MHYLKLILSYWAAILCSVACLRVENDSGRCSGLIEPRGLSNPNPFLSWLLVSETNGEYALAYQIQVSLDSSFVEVDKWDSDKVLSNVSSTPYEGQALRSREIVYWRVRAWNQDDQVSEWCTPNQFEMGLLHQEDWSANWIENSQYICGVNSMPIFAKPFAISCPITKGRLYVSGLGQYHAQLNGRDVSDEVLAPGYSNLNKTLFYSTYDVTSLLSLGQNVLVVELGKGLYDPEPALDGRYMKFSEAPKNMKLIAQLEYSCIDGSYNIIESDDTWITTVNGPRIESSWYGGEEYDARKIVMLDLPSILSETVPNRTVNRENSTHIVDQTKSSMYYSSNLFQQALNLAPGKRSSANSVQIIPICNENNMDMTISSTHDLMAGTVYESNTKNDILGAHTFSLRPIWSSSHWIKANYSGPPASGILASPEFPPLKIIEEIPAVSVNKIDEVWVFDLGQNFAGWYSLRMKGSKGTRVTIYPSELLAPSGKINQTSTGFPIYDGYTFATDDWETFSPKFMYHGFRYLQVNLTSEPSSSDLVGLRIRASAEQVGNFSCSNSLLNSIHSIIDKSIQSNMYSVLTDCPHREKFGWLEQSHLVYGPLEQNYDILAVGRALVRAIAEAQTLDGLIPDIAPEYYVFWDPFRDDPNWGNAGIRLPLKLYQSYGDIQLLRDYFHYMDKYMDYLSIKADGFILDYGLADWFGFDSSTSAGITATYGYQQAVEAMVTISKALKRQDDIQKYENLNYNILKAFHQRFFNAETFTYGSGSQAANAFALDMGAVPAKYKDDILQNLVKCVEDNEYHTTVGEIGLPSFFRALQMGKRNDILYKVMTSTTNPSYGYQVIHGATALTEAWDGPTFGVSQNHFMLGYGDSWITSLAGISQEMNSVAWSVIRFEPIVIGDLNWVSYSHKSIKGTIKASWKLKNHTFHYDITVPVGSIGHVYLPSGDYRSNSKLTDDMIVVSSGKHSFSLELYTEDR